MTAVGFTTAQESNCRVHGGIAKEKVKPLLVVSADSRDSVERIRQTPSDESATRNFADGICKIRSQKRSVRTDDPVEDTALVLLACTKNASKFGNSGSLLLSITF